MLTKIIGFVGVDKYDIVLYLSRILHHAGKKVLLADYSETKALKLSIPTFDLERNIDYRGVDFMNKEEIDDDIKEKYDYICIDFGFCLEHKELKYCDYMVFVTDVQLHNIKRLNSILVPMPKFLVVRDVGIGKITIKAVLYEFNKNVFEKEESISMKWDDIDYNLKILCQYNAIFKFKKISSDFKQALFSVLDFIELPGCDTEKAYQKAEREGSRR